MNGKKLSEMSLAELWRLFPIELTAPNPRWADDYAEMEQRLSSLLYGLHPRLYHIGSTAIGGIWAKPIVDVLAEFAAVEDMSHAAELLQREGFRMMSREDNRVTLNLGYTEKGFADKVYHIHLRLRGDRDEVYFRDHLKAHPAIAKDYETLKLGLWKQYEFDRNGYTDAKTDFIRNHTETAKRIAALFERLTPKDTKDGYQALLELEAISDEMDILYPYAQRFANMVSSELYAVRVRGFRLLCKQAQWDVDQRLDEPLDRALSILRDPKPTAVRMALAALLDVLPYKPALRDRIRDAAQDIPYGQYRDSMQGLIFKDVQRLLTTPSISEEDKRA